MLILAYYLLLLAYYFTYYLLTTCLLLKTQATLSAYWHELKFSTKRREPVPPRGSCPSFCYSLRRTPQRHNIRRIPLDSPLSLQCHWYLYPQRYYVGGDTRVIRAFLLLLLGGLYLQSARTISISQRWFRKLTYKKREVYENGNNMKRIRIIGKQMKRGSDRIFTYYLLIFFL